MINRVTFLSDNPPLKTKGSGISVLLYNIVDALTNSYKISIVTFAKDCTASLMEIVDDNATSGVYICDSNILKLYSKLKYGLLKSLFELLSFIFCLPALLRRFNRDGDVIFTVVGASIKPVFKAWVLMKLARNAKHVIYIVDDLELINTKYNNKLELFFIKIFLRRTIEKADQLLTISEGLKDLYFNKYNISSLILFPHFNKRAIIEERKSSDSDFIFLFTGGLNILYNSSLQIFGEAIRQLNLVHNNIKLKLVIQTYSNKSEYDKLKFDPSCVFYSTSADRADLIKVYNKSDCFLVPYSFDELDKGIVETSFPQKTAEIIQYGKKILVFGPAYSSANLFFVNNQLDFVCSNKSIEHLKTIINKIITSPFSESNYIKAYERHLSAQAVLNIFNKLDKNLTNEN